MLAYIDTEKNIICGTHDESQNVDPSAYGPKTRVILVPPGQYRPGSPAPPVTKQGLHDYAALMSKRTQARGVSVDGHLIATDSPGELSHIQTSLDLGHLELATVKTKDKKFFPADGKYFEKIHSAVAKHLNNTRSKESAVSSGIDDGSIETYDQIDYLFSMI